MPALFATARDVIEQLGLAKALTQAAPWWLRRRYVVLAKNLEELEGSSTASSPRVDAGPMALRLATERDLEVMVRARPSFYDLAELRERLCGGHLGLLAESGGELTHLRWIFVGSLRPVYLPRILRLAPGDGFVDDIYTVPRWRRRGVESLVARSMLEVMHGRGFRRAVGAVASWNRAPQRIGSGLGYRQIASFAYWRFLGARRFFSEGALREVGDATVALLPEG